MFVSGLLNTSVAQEPEQITGVVMPIPTRHALCAPVKEWPVTAIHVVVGQQVQKGQCLVEMDPAMLPQRKAQAEWDSAKARLDVLQANLKVCKQNMERAICLLKTNSTSQQEVDERTGATQVLERELIQAKANEQAAGVAFAMAKYDYDNYQRILSPIAGEVVAVNCALGMVARAEDKKLMWIEVLDSSRVQITCSVSPQVAKVLKVRLVVKKPLTLEGVSSKAEVVAVPRMVTNGKVNVVLEADNPNFELVCGQEVKIILPK
jgi:multidrug efflux pump subunit AcrA (membrane-fusion protein)